MISIAIFKAALKYGISVSLLFGVCLTESGLDPQAINFSDGGTPSFGLCQVKWETARMMNKRVRYSDLLRAETNAELAAAYLRYQLNRYEGDEMKAISAYNAGSYTSKNAKYVIKVLANREKYYER